jgi:hypothetical protein
MGMLFLFEETFPRNLRDSLIHSRPPKHVQKGNIHCIYYVIPFTRSWYRTIKKEKDREA